MNRYSMLLIPGFHRRLAFPLAALLLTLTAAPVGADDGASAPADRADTPPVVTPMPVDHYSPQRIVEALQRGEKLVFLDVREPEEFAENHIPGAINIPERLLEARRDEIPTEGTLIPYCNMDFRGFVAIDALRSLGFTDVALMQERGIEGWQQQGLPIMDARKGISEATAREKLMSMSPKELLGERFQETVPATGVKHEISMVVSEWYFDPNDLEVGAGDTVEIEVRSDKGNHFFILPDYAVQTEVPQGEMRRVSFVADRAGTFRFGTCEWDGSSLQVMKGRLRVK